MSEQSLAQNQPNTNRRRTGITVAVAAGLAIGASGGALGMNAAQGPNKAPHLQAELDQQTKTLAQARAAEFTAALYDRAHYPKGVKMSVINGEIVTTINTVSGKHEGIYKNPILLVATRPIDDADKQGNFLQGAYIGIQGNDENGKAVITAQPYDPKTEVFKPYDPAHVMLPDSLAVYPTAIKGGPGLDIDGLVGFDSTGEVSLANGDHSEIRPGLSEGMK